MRINLNRLRAEMLELSDFGRRDDLPGIYRMAFTEADMAARRWLIQRVESLGGRARLDGAGNVIGRFGPTGVRPRAVEAIEAAGYPLPTGIFTAAEPV